MPDFAPQKTVGTAAHLLAAVKGSLVFYSVQEVTHHGGVVCPAMLGEFTPVQQRGAVLAIYGAIYTLAGMIAPSVMGVVIQNAVVPLDGYMTGFTINAVVMAASGLLGLLLLWPNTERARLIGEVTVQPKFA